MNHIFDNVSCDFSCFTNYLATLKKNKVINKRDKIRKVIQEATEELVSNFQYIPLDIDHIFTALENHLLQNSVILGTAFAFSPEIRSSCPFILRDKNGFESRDIAEEIRYSNTLWYEVPVRQRKAVWSVPYFDIGKAGEDVLLTTYSIPLFDDYSKLLGVIISDLLLARLEDIQK